ncbi:MAG: SusF/SusE family outer membrane protein [Bacteroidales bacterium]|nr:SusF/SusE family outer membrane protein [Bacteroidales bacterium]
MKKFLSIIIAGAAALAAVSCAKQELVQFDDSKATAPVVNSYDVTEDGVFVDFTAGSFNQSFNQKMPVNHSLVLLAADGKSVNKILSSSIAGNVISVSTVTLSRTLLAQGYEEGSVVSLELALRASMQESARDNLRNGFMEAVGRISIPGFEIVLPQGSPYEEYTEISTWTVIGAVAAYEMNWDKDLVMWTDGKGNHVAAHVNLTADDEFKFRKDQDWGVNFGGDYGSLDNEFSLTQDGPNIKVGAAGVYDIFFNENGQAWIANAYDPYPEFTEASTWSVIGALSLAGINWDGDIAMMTDGTTHVALSVALAAADEFKFRKDADWAVNMGGEYGSIDTDFPVTQDGANIKVGADGVFDLFVNPDAGTARVANASGAKVSYILGSDEPDPEEPVAVTGWNIIGLNGNWDTDVLAAQEGNVWTAYITADGDTEFKWRKDGAWDENYGGVMTALGEPFEAVAGGDNIKIGAGFYKVVLDTGNLTITVSEGNVWSLIGDFNSWGGDVDMTEADGVWTSPVTKISGGFKIRYNHGWDTNVGGVMTAVGEPFEAVPGGDNISVEEGNYIVTYDTNAGTITVSTAGWGVVGTINSWGDTPDTPLREEANHSYLVARNVAVSASDEIKVRYNNNWDNNFGADTKLGTAVKAYAGGNNIKPGIDGAVDVYFFPAEEVLLVAEAGTDPAYWGVVGTINSWGVPDRILFEKDGKLVSNEIQLSASDEIKIRQNEAWDVNRGGAFAELGQAFAVENNGANIKVGRDAKVVVVYDPAAETITLEGEYTGEAPSLPETMYIIGDGVGGWDWGADYIVNMTPVNGKPGQFWAIRNIEAGKGFKFCAVKEWNGDFTGLGEDSGYTVSDGNCFVAENGVYMIYVDSENKKVCVEPAKVYGMGSCFGGWTEAMENALFTAADGKLSITVAASGELRIYAASSIATSDWWTREFIILDGKIAYRGNGGDQERVNVNAGQKVTLDFNAGTGTIE